MTPDDVSSRPPATGDQLEPVTPEKVDAKADVKAHLSAIPSADLSGSSRPRGPGEISMEGYDPKKEVKADINDPLGGIPSVPADVIAGVPESQVTEKQTKSVSSGSGTGQSQTPPASTAP